MKIVCLFRLLLAFGFGIFLIPTSSHALDPSKSLFQYNCRNWSRENGLPVNSVRALAQDQAGYLWLGTQKGLLRFDGFDFTPIAMPNVPQWRGQTVISLAAGAEGGIWFGLDAAAFGYLDSESHFELPPGGWANPQMGVHSICETADGATWIASGNGIARWVRGQTNASLFDANIGVLQSLGADSQHRVWIGSVENGLFYWEAGKIHAFPDPTLAKQTIFAIEVDRQGRIWVGTQLGLHCYGPDFKPLETLPPLYNEVRALLEDRQGALWIGTSGSGVIRIFNGQAITFQKTNGLANNYVTALLEDREGSLWVGTREGLTQISDVKFPIFTENEGLLGGACHGLAASAKGGVWIASNHGLCYFDGHSSASYALDAGLSVAYVKRVLEARDGDVYLINANREIEIFADGKVVSRFANADWPTALAEDSKGVVAAIGSNLFRVSRAGLTPYVFQGTPPGFYWIRNLFSCPDGSMIVASVDGVFRLRGDAIEHWSVGEGLSDPDVLWASEDKEKNIWVGQRAGITRIRGTNVVAIQDPLIDTRVFAIVPDDRGNMWVSSGKGILRVTSKSLNAVADGKSSPVDGIVYDGLEAIKTIDNTETEYVGCKSVDGRIWFPTPQGPVAIDPGHIPTNPIPPPVYIQSVRVNGVEKTLRDARAIPPGRGELLFQYTALSYIAPGRIRFRYQLQGYDAEWVDAGARRSALYANLKPGAYTFRVQACNADGIWNETGDEFQVTLPPHYYQTRWFRLALIGAALLLLFGLYIWRVGHLHRKERELQDLNALLETRIHERTQELAEQRNLLRTLIDHLPDEVFVKDTGSRVIIDNLAHARTLGVSDPGEAVGKTDFDCFPADKAERFRQAEQELLKSGTDYNAEEHISLKNGRVRWQRTTKVPLRDGRGEIIGLAGIHRDITDRKKWEAELESLHKQLLETSRQAGMAEVATSVLHNVGNVLNSVNVSATIVEDQVRNSALDRLSKVIELLQENKNDLAGFLTRDEKGVKLIGYLDALFKTMSREKVRVQEEIQSLTRNVEHIKKIVSMQQSYARVAGLVEQVKPAELMEDALRMHEAAYHRHFVQVVREFDDAPAISVDRHKVIQILVNLLGNAKYACDVNDPQQRFVHVRIRQSGAEQIRLEVSDNGMGIAPENLTRIFGYGFTTRKTGHGFGLHSGALAAKEMGGSLRVQSEGDGHGATFILELPTQPKAEAPTASQKRIAAAEMLEGVGA